MRQFIVDAFTEKIFGGNPAGVCVMENFPPEELMRNIAMENNLSETAFAVKEENFYRLRWFTPAAEVDFCGHATLATAYVLFNYYEKNSRRIEFETLSGKFFVERKDNLFEMDFPAYNPKKIPVTYAMQDTIGAKVLEAYLARDLLMVLESAEAVENLSPNLDKLKDLDAENQSTRRPRYRLNALFNRAVLGRASWQEKSYRSASVGSRRSFALRSFWRTR